MYLGYTVRTLQMLGTMKILATFTHAICFARMMLAHSWSDCFDGDSMVRGHESTLILIFNGKTVFSAILHMSEEKIFPNEIELCSMLTNASRLCSELAGLSWVTLSTSLTAWNEGVAGRSWARSDSQFLQRIWLGMGVRICSLSIVVSGWG